MRPIVSVVIPTRNRPGLLVEALGSVTSQQGLALDAIEVIVVNDGGIRIGGCVDPARGNGLRISVIDLPHRHGLPIARNVGIDHARGAYLALLDDDDIYLPTHLCTALEALDGFGPDADLVYTSCLVSSVRLDPTAPASAPDAFDFRFDPGLLEVANIVPVHSAVFRNPGEAWRFDPELGALEDWDFWLQLQQARGYRFVHVPEPTVVYHRIPGEASMTGEATSHAAVLAEFGHLARRVWRRWPATNAKVTRFRAWSGIMYWYALSLMVTNARPTFNYYLHSMHALAEAWFGVEPEDAMLERLADTVMEETADASVIA